MGNRAHIPVVSFSAISSSLSPTQFPYLVRVAQNVCSQVNAITAVIQAYGWKKVSLIHDESQSGVAILPYLVDALEEINVICSRISLPSIANRTLIKNTLASLNGTNARVFIVHLSFSLSAQFFLSVKSAGMMRTGYAWIVTCGTMDLLGYMDHSVLHHMEGVIGVKTHIPPSKAVRTFRVQWMRKFRQENFTRRELSVYALWAYDTTYIVAITANKAGVNSTGRLLSSSSIMARDTMDVFGMDVSSLGSKFLQSILSTEFSGLSGEIQLVDGQLQSSTFEIINVRKARGHQIGYWTRKSGLSQRLDGNGDYSVNEKDLAAIIWPGGSKSVPRAKTLIVGVPVKTGFVEFMNVSHGRKDISPTISGFSREVFDEVMQALPYQLDYVPFEDDHGVAAGDYNDLTYEVHLKKFDAVVGDVTILANRSKYVDFTQPYSVSGFRMIVPIENNDFTQGPWWFLKPLTGELWLITIALFFLKGILVWIFEHGINPEFQGTFSQQVGKILSFSFSTFVFAHREKLESNYSRFTVNMWTFAVFVLVTSYGANLTSMLTVDNLRPMVTNLDILLREGKSVGYQNGSFIFDFLRDYGFAEKKLVKLSKCDDYAKALLKGSEKGGVSAVVDEIPYINVFLKNHCHQYTVVGTTYPTGGFGFVFPKGSPLVSEVSEAVLAFTEGEKMKFIENRWFGSEICQDPLLSNGTTKKLHLYSFRSIYEIMAVASGIALLLFIVSSAYKHAKDGHLIETLRRVSMKSWNRKSPPDHDNRIIGESARADVLEPEPIHDITVETEPIHDVTDKSIGRTQSDMEQGTHADEQVRGGTPNAEMTSKNSHVEMTPAFQRE